jgi:hypothetical protein
MIVVAGFITVIVAVMLVLVPGLFDRLLRRFVSF